MHTTTPGIDLPRPRLPAPLTELVGRQREVEAVRRLLASSRLLTLTGADGSGKTRLAIELARRAAENGSTGLAWVELAPVADEALVARTVATALGLREAPGRPAADVLLECIADREFLLVLDNCEHVIGASAALADQLLRGCPRLRILATSREPLGVAGEVAWLVPPLSLPAPEAPIETLEASEAVRLFVDRATDALPSFTLSESNAGAVAEICRRLDGMPLAIELAAARVRVLPPREISKRLNDAFRLLVSGSRTALPRHRTLRTAFDWSYHLLDDRERLVFERLSAFAGGWTIGAAESVCAGQGIEPEEVLDLLAALVEKSMVAMREVGGAARYFLLETVRQYAAERLAASGTAEAVHERHARFYLEQAREAEPHLTTPRRRSWVDALLADFDNLRLALMWTRRCDPAVHLELVGRLCWFWFSSGHWMEGRQWLEGALAGAPAGAAVTDRARALFALGVLASLQGDPDAARPRLEESARLAGSAGDRRQRAYALAYLAITLGQSNAPEVLDPAEEAVALFREEDDPYGLRLSLVALGTALTARGELARAVAVLEEAVAIARSFAQDRDLASACNCLGVALLQQGDVARAAALLREAIAALGRDPQPFFLARSLEMLGVARCEERAAREAVLLFAAADAIRERIRAAPFQIDRDFYAPRRARDRASTVPAACRTAQSGARYRSRARDDRPLRAHPARTPGAKAGWRHARRAHGRRRRSNSNASFGTHVGARAC